MMDAEPVRKVASSLSKRLEGPLSSEDDAWVQLVPKGDAPRTAHTTAEVY